MRWHIAEVFPLLFNRATSQLVEVCIPRRSHLAATASCFYPSSSAVAVYLDWVITARKGVVNKNLSSVSIIYA
jgi:hypothetical protein